VPLLFKKIDLIIVMKKIRISNMLETLVSSLNKKLFLFVYII